MKHRSSLVCAAALLAACAGPRTPDTAPPPLPPTAVPAAPEGRTQVPVPDVPLPDPTESPEVTLEQILAYADAHAPVVRLARARALRGDAEVEGAKVLLQANPQVGMAFGGRTIGPSNFFEARAWVWQRLEIAGERRMRIRAAERLRETARAEVDEARWAVHVEVHARFLEALAARWRVQAAERFVAFAEEVAAIATRRIEVGEDPPLARLVVEAELAQARERLVEARRQEIAARTRLAQAAGWPADPLPIPKGDPPAVRRTRSPDALARLAAEHHPSLRVRALAVEAAAARLRAEKREAWPEPMVGARYSHEAGPGPDENVWLFTLQVPIPLWNRNQAGRARAEADLEAAKAERSAVHLAWRARLERVAAGVDAAAERVEIYADQVLPALDENLELIRRAYELGEIDINAVSQTRERVLDTQMRAIEAHADYYRTLADLEAAVGTESAAALQEPSP